MKDERGKKKVESKELQVSRFKLRVSLSTCLRIYVSACLPVYLFPCLR